MAVHYVGKLEDGTVFDESSEGNPLKFEVGSGQMIPGFDAGVRGMKVGEAKTLTLSPDDAYGAEYVQVQESKEAFSEWLKFTIPVAQLQDVIEQQVPKSILPEKTDYSEGAIVDVAGYGFSGTVVSSTETEVVLSIENRHPFYGQELVVGLEGIGPNGAQASILDITDTEVQIEVENLINPFAGQELVAGLEAEDQAGNPIRVVEVLQDIVLLEIKNPHNLAGKTLIFDVTVESIESVE